MDLRVHDTANWPIYKKAYYRLYKPLIENPARARLRNKVIAMPSLSVDEGFEYSIHCLICSRDVDMLICSARTVAFACGYSMPYVLHDDGSLTDNDEAKLLDKLPGVRVIRRAESNERANDELAKYPRIRAYRDAQVMALKLVDAKIWGSGVRFGYIDSDIIFLKKPEEYLAALSGGLDGTPNLFNKDLNDAYVTSRDRISEAVGIEPYPQVNAGLWVMRRQDICLDTIEDWLGLPIFNERPHFYTLDQTFISMLANQSTVGAAHLESGYDVAFRKSVQTNVTKHYVGRIRHGFEMEGLAYLLGDQGLPKKWNKLCLNV